jgi:hypothetical protein
MKVFSGQANQLLSQIDSSRKPNGSKPQAGHAQGVTKGDLAKLDLNRDGQISRSEAPGVSRQDLSVFNSALKDGRAATEVVFVSDSGNADASKEQGLLARIFKRTPSSRPTYRPSAETQAVSKKLGGNVKGVAKGTGYYPANTKMEGGFKDKIGKPLRTLQDFLDGKSSYVSIALDKNLYKSGKIKYGDTFRIPELEAKYGRKIIFKAVDTGGAFTNKGFSKVDICTRSKQHSLEPTLNRQLTLVKTD